MITNYIRTNTFCIKCKEYINEFNPLIFETTAKFANEVFEKNNVESLETGYCSNCFNNYLKGISKVTRDEIKNSSLNYISQAHTYPQLRDLLYEIPTRNDFDKSYLVIKEDFTILYKVRNVNNVFTKYFEHQNIEIENFNNPEYHDVRNCLIDLIIKVLNDETIISNVKNSNNIRKIGLKVKEINTIHERSPEIYLKLVVDVIEFNEEIESKKSKFIKDRFDEVGASDFFKYLHYIDNLF